VSLSARPRYFQSIILTGHSQPHAPTAYVLFTRLPSLSTNQAARVGSRRNAANF
ncbi:uncharacterized protein BDZ99DRAFT_461632, partial [Mytilinidion resinicola]